MYINFQERKPIVQFEPSGIFSLRSIYSLMYIQPMSICLPDSYSADTNMTAHAHSTDMPI